MLAAEIDEKMKELRAANPFISTNQAAVLIALDYANSAKKAEQSLSLIHILTSPAGVKNDSFSSFISKSFSLKIFTPL